MDSLCTGEWHRWSFWSVEGLISIMDGDAVSEGGKVEIEMSMSIERVLWQPFRLLDAVC